MKWDYPVHNLIDVNADHSSGTVAKAMRVALDAQVAFYTLAGDSRKPLLVLRECRLCNGTDDALLSRAGSNERTLIMARWFHCVKMPIEVLEEDHPFTKVFEEEHPPHLFLARWDGSNPMPLRGDLSRTELWGNMYTMLESEYKKDAEKAVKEIEKILAQYDMIDEKIARLEIAIDDEIERRGPESKGLKKMRQQLEEAQADMVNLKEKEAKLSMLDLKPLKEEPAFDISQPHVGK
ncbi:MAG: hypothetical protein O3A95_08220 [Planctomycetota bacterium]|nr:hypothetical protein [Planctomycetota bacterium]MDA1114268.1 hypothetical protein [Planctomycetota bacterium]